MADFIHHPSCFKTDIYFFTTTISSSLSNYDIILSICYTMKLNVARCPSKDIQQRIISSTVFKRHQEKAGNIP